jgi:hypothetical protein
MLESLCKLIQLNEDYFNIYISFSKICDWTIDIYLRNGIGEQTILCSNTNCDLELVSAKSYINVTDWLSDKQNL